MLVCHRTAQNLSQAERGLSFRHARPEGFLEQADNTQRPVGHEARGWRKTHVVLSKATALASGAATLTTKRTLIALAAILRMTYPPFPVRCIGPDSTCDFESAQLTVGQSLILRLIASFPVRPLFSQSPALAHIVGQYCGRFTIDLRADMVPSFPLGMPRPDVHAPNSSKSFSGFAPRSASRKFHIRAVLNSLYPQMFRSSGSFPSSSLE